MTNNYGCIDPLLSNLAADYSKKVREGLVAPLLLPRIPVAKPSGKYAKFDKANAYKVPDVTFAGERAQAHEFNTTGVMEPYATQGYALKNFIDHAELEMMDGPFNMWEKQKTENIVGKLELAQEKRVADKVLTIAGRNTTLTGVGTDSGKKWSDAGESAGGDPHADIRAAINQCFYRPNIMILNESVFDALEYNPRLLSKLGEANMIKKASEETLAKLFRIDRVVIAEGRADFTKKNAEGGANVASIWGNCVVLAYTSAVWDESCAGKTLAVKFKQADNAGYIVRKWDEPDGGA